MAFDTLSDKQVIKQLGEQFDLMRRFKRIQDKEILEKSGLSSRVLAKFRSGQGNITLESFVRLLRAIDKLEQLESLLEIPNTYSPTQGDTTLPEKVRKHKQVDQSFEWGED